MPLRNSTGTREKSKLKIGKVLSDILILFRENFYDSHRTLYLWPGLVLQKL
jgi:hypothetical protein